MTLMCGARKEGGEVELEEVAAAAGNWEDDDNYVHTIVALENDIASRRRMKQEKIYVIMSGKEKNCLLR